MKSKKVCFSKEIFYLGCIVLSLIGYLIIDKLSIYFGKEELIKKEDCKCECPVVEKTIEKPRIIEKEKVVVVDNSDIPSQYERGPRRDYIGRGMPINIPTRGAVGKYQNIGLLKNPNDPNDVKPLYGRMTYRGSNMWNYYCLLNNHIQVQIPIIRENNCLDNRGCKEIVDKETVNVNGIDYKAEIYPYSDLRYIPYL